MSCMACKRSAVRARLAPPRSKPEFERLTGEPSPSEGHSEGQDPSETGRLTSDDAELCRHLDQKRFPDVQEVTSCCKVGFRKDRTRCGLRNLISCLVPSGEWWSSAAWAAVIRRSRGRATGVTSRPIRRVVLPFAGLVARGLMGSGSPRQVLPQAARFPRSAR
jgi:hypothetical protein